MSEALKARILRAWHHPEIQKLIGGRGDELWNAGPEKIYGELLNLMKTNPNVYWSAPVQEALACTTATREYIANAGNLDYEPSPMQPAPEVSDARLWAEWRAQGGGTSSGGRLGDADGEPEPREGHRAMRNSAEIERDAALARYAERAAASARPGVNSPARQPVLRKTGDVLGDGPGSWLDNFVEEEAGS